SSTVKLNRVVEAAVSGVDVPSSSSGAALSGVAAASPPGAVSGVAVASPGAACTGPDVAASPTACAANAAPLPVRRHSPASSAAASLRQLFPLILQFIGFSPYVDNEKARSMDGYTIMPRARVKGLSLSFGVRV